MDYTITAPCEMYRDHGSSPCAIADQHHVVPESWWRAAGLDVPADARRAVLCPNCHRNVHRAIDAMVYGVVPRDDVPPRAVRMAQQAMDGALAAGLTPRPTL